MIPILLSGTTVTGFLPDALTCVVTEERNGIFELSMTYPVTGQMFSQLSVDRFIKAKPNDTAAEQLFRIYEITKPLNGIVTVNAEHISYALSHFPVNGLSITGTATQAINAVLSNARGNLASAHGFSVGTTDMADVKPFSLTVSSARSALGSILDIFGGEYEFDNYVIRLHAHRGSDTGVIVSYGKNLTDIKLSTSMENSFTALFPYCLKDDALTVLSERRISVTNNSGIAERVMLMDFTSLFKNDEDIAEVALRTKATEWLSENDINCPSINLTVSFIHLWQSPEYASFAALEKVSLCDYVTVRHSVLGIDVKAQVIKTVYDTLGERYSKIELGSAKANFADTIKQTTQKLQEAINLVKSTDASAITQAYLQAIEDATNAITGNSGGYVALNPSQNPQELLIMNTTNKNTAAKLWRWNLGGLGYSSNGYSGPFRTAITMNGAINADFITAGTLTANIIRAGVLSSADGSSFFNLESGAIQTSRANITGGTISIGGDSYRTVINNGHIGQYVTASSNVVGGLVPTGGSRGLYETIYCSSTADSLGVCIATEASNGTYAPLALFCKNAIELNMPTIVYSDFAVSGKITNSLAFSDESGIALFCGDSSARQAFRYYGGSVCCGVDTKPMLLIGTTLKCCNSLLPSTGSAYYLGTSSVRWAGAYFSGKIACGGVACLNGTGLVLNNCEAFRYYGGAVCCGAIDYPLKLYGSGIRSVGSLYPDADASYNFGSSSMKWYNGFFSNSVYCTHLYPNTNGEGTVGGSSSRWKAVYSDNLFVDAISMNIGSSTYNVVCQYYNSHIALGVMAKPLDFYASSFYQNGNPLPSGLSSEKYKKDIERYTGSALDMIDSAVIYSFRYKEYVENLPDGRALENRKKYGVVIERECPMEIIDNSGDAVSLISMAALAWKAVQELSARLRDAENTILQLKGQIENGH